jgi:hypothetical protein
MKITWRGFVDGPVTGSIEGTMIEVDRRRSGTCVFYLMPGDNLIGRVSPRPGGWLSDEEIIERALAFAVSAILEGKV